jgi:glycerol-3-phosphate O-acyltransferase 3/4
LKLFCKCFQYGRQNIEHVRKRNGNWTVDGHDSDDEDGESTSNNEENTAVGFCKSEKKNQNGAIGNSVIARSKDLILVPEPEMQNHNDDSEMTNEASTEKDNSHLHASKEVN